MRFMTGFFIGLILGAAAILLTAPQSGNDLQSGVRSRLEELLDEGRQAATSRRAELEARLAELQAS